VPVAAAFAVVVVADSHRRPLSLLLLLLAVAVAGEGHEAGRAVNRGGGGAGSTCGRAVNRVRAGVSGIRGVDVEAGAVYCSICRNPLRIQRSYSNNPSAAVSGLPSVIARPTSRPHNFRSPHEHFPRLPVADGHGPPPAHGAHRRRRRRDGGGRAAGILRRGGRGGAGGGGGPGGGRHAAGAGARNRHDVLRVHGSRGGRALRPPRRAPRRRVAAPEPRPRRFRPRARQGPSAGPVIPPLSFLRPSRAPSRRIVFFSS
jgi:hypothetical protein